MHRVNIMSYSCYQLVLTHVNDGECENELS